MKLVRLVLRPLGLLAFVAGLAALSAAAWLLGEADEVGFFSGRLARTVRRYPEVMRGGVQMAWLAWLALFGVALSPIDPLATRWDEGVLAAVAVCVLWHRFAGERQAGR
jgi:hypothetical protein